MTTNDKDKIIAAEKDLGVYFGGDGNPPEWIERFYTIAFEAGAASRDAEIAELKDALGYDLDKYKASQMALRECMQMVVEQDAERDELKAVIKNFLCDWDSCRSSGEWPVRRLGELRAAIAKVRKP